jgi:hypothetical protein
MREFAILPDEAYRVVTENRALLKPSCDAYRGRKAQRRPSDAYLEHSLSALAILSTVDVKESDTSRAIS